MDQLIETFECLTTVGCSPVEGFKCFGRSTRLAPADAAPPLPEHLSRKRFAPYRRIDRKPGDCPQVPGIAMSSPTRHHADGGPAPAHKPAGSARHRQKGAEHHGHAVLVADMRSSLISAAAEVQPDDAGVAENAQRIHALGRSADPA